MEDVVLMFDAGSCAGSILFHFKKLPAKVLGRQGGFVVTWGRLQKGVKQVRIDLRTNGNWKDCRFVKCYITFLYSQLC